MTHPIHPQSQSPSRTVALLLVLIAATMASPALADSVSPPPPPIVDTPPPPPAPATVDPSEAVYHVVARPVYAQPAPAPQPVAAPQPAYQYQYGDPYGFTAWLNGVRAQNGRGPVGHDPGLSGQAAVNNSYGFGHHYMGSARRQNSGMGAASTVWQMWMASKDHRDALLDPTISFIGIAASGAYWTFNAY